MKLSEYENPINGRKSNIFDIGNLWEQVLGILVLIVVIVLGFKLASFIFPTQPATASSPVERVKFTL